MALYYVALFKVIVRNTIRYLDMGYISLLEYTVFLMATSEATNISLSKTYICIFHQSYAINVNQKHCSGIYL